MAVVVLGGWEGGYGCLAAMWGCCGAATGTSTPHRWEFKLNIKCRGENERSRTAAGDEGR